MKTRDRKTRDCKTLHQTAGLENAGLEKARTDWLWKADQAQTADTLPDVNLRGMTAARQWNCIHSTAAAGCIMLSYFPTMLS